MNYLNKKMTNLKNLSKGYLITNIILVIIVATSYLGDKFYNGKSKRRTMNTLIPSAVILQYLSTMIFLFIKYRLIDEIDKRKFKNTFTFLLISGFIIMISAISFGGGIFKFKICAKVFSVAFLVWMMILTAGNSYNSKMLELK